MKESYGDSSLPYSSLISLGYLARKEKRFNDSERLFKKALSKNSTFPDAYIGLIELYSDFNISRDISELMKKMNDHDLVAPPENAFALAKLYYIRGRDKEAMRYSHISFQNNINTTESKFFFEKAMHRDKNRKLEAYRNLLKILLEEKSFQAAYDLSLKFRENPSQLLMLREVWQPFSDWLFENQVYYEIFKEDQE